MDIDLRDMRAKSFILTDKQGNDFVKYKEMIGSVQNRQHIATDLHSVHKIVTKVQAAWRGYVIRKNYLKMKENELKMVAK